MNGSAYFKKEYIIASKIKSDATSTKSQLLLTGLTNCFWVKKVGGFFNKVLIPIPNVFEVLEKPFLYFGMVMALWFGTNKRQTNNTAPSRSYKAWSIDQFVRPLNQEVLVKLLVAKVIPGKLHQAVLSLSKADQGTTSCYQEQLL